MEKEQNVPPSPKLSTLLGMTEHQWHHALSHARKETELGLQFPELRILITSL